MIRKFSSLVFCFLFLGSAWSAIAVAGDEYSRRGTSDFDLWCQELDNRTEARYGLFFSPLVGQELDFNESHTYNMMRHTDGFLSARLPVDAKGRIKLELTRIRMGNQYTTRRNFPPASLRLTRLHFYLSEQYAELPPWGSGPQDEADLLLRMALRFAARGRYDLVEGVLEDLGSNFRETEAGSTANLLLADVRALRSKQQVLIWGRSGKRGEGNNDLKLFGGYYGLWLGMAVPLALEADSPEPYGVGLIVGGPAGFMAANAATRMWDISEGDATMIELGGNMGTWQGLGWAAKGGADGGAVVGYGVVTGLAGIALAAAVTSRYEFNEGHAALTAAAMPWGIWFGIVAASISDIGSDDRDDGGWNYLTTTLITSDALVLTTGVLARNVEMSEKRVRLINLMGIIGSVMGVGVNLVAQPDDGEIAMAIIGAAGVVGLVAGFPLTAKVDRDEYAGRFPDGTEPGDVLATGPSIQFPQVSIQPNLMTGRGVMPAVGARVRF